MTVDEAIKIDEDIRDNLDGIGQWEKAQAVNLGIEALIRLKEHREAHIDITFRALPGETKE